jgi:hypothetical protein
MVEIGIDIVGAPLQATQRKSCSASADLMFVSVSNGTNPLAATLPVCVSRLQTARGSSLPCRQ